MAEENSAPQSSANGTSAEAPRQQRTGWASGLARAVMGLLLFEIVSGLAITLLPFHSAVQWNLIVHTVAGAVMLLPLAWYCGQHWLDYKRHPMSSAVLLGYVALIALLVCSISGVVVTWQGVFGTRTSGFWRNIHLATTLATLATILPHVFLSFFRVWRDGPRGVLVRYVQYGFAVALLGAVFTVVFTYAYPGATYENKFPGDYSFLYGTNRPFAPSLAKTDTGGAFDAVSLAGSASCGTAGCHEQIVEEWLPSAHRYAAMDPVFQGIQDVMAKQNGPESTRYCGGCHDPISLFSGTKNIFVENLTGLHGYQEGVSCLACHAIRETDVKGNANYTVTQPREYLWQWQTNGLGKLARDFLIRSYPAEHNKLAKRTFKKPEYCAACHKQFIDQEVNRVGWVQLQNQYDNWAASHWNHKGNPQKTIECRECHMPLVDSSDPAAGDLTDYNRRPDDKKHRSHRFIASNQLIPEMLKLPGWEQQTKLTEEWLQGKFRIPEIEDKWPGGAIVKLALEAPPKVTSGNPIPLRVILASNKVGHDFPTGPLDIIQSWLEVRVADDRGTEIFRSGTRDTNHFIQPGSFLFKAEPVDAHGNLIDRHNLWEMVGVRYRRALFPGYSDAVQYLIECPSTVLPASGAEPRKDTNDLSRVQVPAPNQPGRYSVTVALQYRKVDQFLLNHLFGSTNKITSPVTEIVRAETTVEVVPKDQASAGVTPEVASAASSERPRSSPQNSRQE